MIFFGLLDMSAFYIGNKRSRRATLRILSWPRGVTLSIRVLGALATIVQVEGMVHGSSSSPFHNEWERYKGVHVTLGEQWPLLCFHFKRVGLNVGLHIRWLFGLQIAEE